MDYQEGFRNCRTDVSPSMTASNRLHVFGSRFSSRSTRSKLSNSGEQEDHQSADKNQFQDPTNEPATTGGDEVCSAMDVAEEFDPSSNGMVSGSRSGSLKNKNTMEYQQEEFGKGSISNSSAEDGMTKCLLNSKKLSEISTDQGPDPGQSSFSTLHPPSSRLEYSGSTSRRSNSSATSAQSFTFPVLPTEWNGSPVRMVEADRRHSRRKSKRWKKHVLCCKF